MAVLHPIALALLWPVYLQGRSSLQGVGSAAAA